jgi:hypothetical protein
MQCCISRAQLSNISYINHKSDSCSGAQYQYCASAAELAASRSRFVALTSRSSPPPPHRVATSCRMPHPPPAPCCTAASCLLLGLRPHGVPTPLLRSPPTAYRLFPICYLLLQCAARVARSHRRAGCRVKGVPINTRRRGRCAPRLGAAASAHSRAAAAAFDSPNWCPQ